MALGATNVEESIKLVQSRLKEDIPSGKDRAYVGRKRPSTWPGSKLLEQEKMDEDDQIDRLIKDLIFSKKLAIIHGCCQIADQGPKAFR